MSGTRHTAAFSLVAWLWTIAVLSALAGGILAGAWVDSRDLAVGWVVVGALFGALVAATPYLIAVAFLTLLIEIAETMRQFGRDE
jgi:hypothetical protein